MKFKTTSDKGKPPKKKEKRNNIRWDAIYANKISFHFIDKILSTFPRFFEWNRHVPVIRDIPVYRDHINRSLETFMFFFPTRKAPFLLVPGWSPGPYVIRPNDTTNVKHFTYFLPQYHRGRSENCKRPLYKHFHHPQNLVRDHFP